MRLVRARMYAGVVLLALACGGVRPEPESVRDNVDYFSYGTGADVLRNLDLHMPKEEVVLQPREVEGWPQQSLGVGQITAVAVNSLGQPVIFHRADRVWDESTFNETNAYQHIQLGPITEPTVLVLEPHTGAVLHGWGANTFYMPHGLSVDRHDNVWLTDVAKHQVYKYTPGNHRHPSLVIGEAFVPGSATRRRVRLCMPTSVAVASTGELFVADGYCNRQILKLSAAGTLLAALPAHGSLLPPLDVPHSVALLERLDAVCVADRENERVVCLPAGLRSRLKMLEPPAVIREPGVGRVFAVAAHGSTLYAVNGPSESRAVKGFTIDVVFGTVVDTWGPRAGFNNPHSVAITQNGSHLYVTEIGPNRVWKFQLVPEDL